MTMFALLGTTEWEVVGDHLKKQYINNIAEKTRMSLAHRRDDFYEGKGDLEIERLIDIAFKDPVTRELRKELVGHSKWNNVIARIVREKSTVYSAPATRKIKNNDETFQAFLSDLQLDDAMREVNRKLVLHEDVLVMYRVRQTPRGRECVIDVVSPASMWAIAHPRDPTMLVGIILDQRAPKAKDSEPAYRVWTDDETFMLDGACRVMPETVEPWPLGRMPGVLATTRKPGAKPRLLAENPSADLVAAQSAVWLQNLLLLKESKSANRQGYVSGDVSRTAMGQSADTESDVFLGEGVSVSTVDRGMDLGQFRDNAEAISDAVGSNHGVPSSIRKLEGASSGAEIHLRRIPLAELRNEQIPVMRRTEAALARIMSLVNSRRAMLITDEHGNQSTVDVPGDLQDFEFSDEGFSVDFGEIAQPLTEAERDAVYEQRRRLLLCDGISEERKRNPDIRTDAEAMTIIKERIENQTKIVAMTKALQALNGSASTEVGEPTAEENGRQGIAKARAQAGSAIGISASQLNASADPA